MMISYFKTFWERLPLNVFEKREGILAQNGKIAAIKRQKALDYLFDQFAVHLL